MSKITEKVNYYKYSLAIWTDKADFITNETKLTDEENLLEIRCFDDRGEFRAYRSTIDADFIEREKNNDSVSSGYFDEIQYLDIDSEFSNGSAKFTVGGGLYHLPEDVKDNTMLKIRYYFDYDQNGIADVYDWRIVGFLR